MDKTLKGDETKTDTKLGQSSSSANIPVKSDQRTVQPANVSTQNKENREIKMIKITVYIIILSILSCIPPFLNTFTPTNYFIVTYTIFFDNCGTPIIYFVADKSFRNEVFQMLKRTK